MSLPDPVGAAATRDPAALLEAGRPEDALGVLAERLTPRAHPDWGLAARAWLALRRADRARGALDRCPPGPERDGIALAILEHEGRLDEAVALLDRSPATPERLLRQGFLALRRGHADTAEVRFRAVLARQPRRAEGWVGLTLALDRLDRADEVMPVLDGVVRRGRATPRLVWAWASVRLRRDPLEVLGPIREALRADLPADLAGLLHHLRGDALDRIGNHERAFVAFEQANRLRAVPFDGGAFEAGAHDLIARTTAGPPSMSGPRRPLLIVGAPRSGTTLLESMLTRHPDIGSAGELQDGRLLAAELQTTGRDPFTLEPGSPAGERLAERYLDALTRRGGPSARVIDKTPGNALLLGFFARVVPGATIVHCVRDAYDVAWSCYRQPFPASLGWTTSLAGIAHWLRAERALMTHWRGTLPLRFVQVRYAELVLDPEAALRPVIQAAGLPWHDAVATWRGGRTDAATASHAEVKQPLHGRSIGRSQPYAAFMGDFTEVWGAVEAP